MKVVRTLKTHIIIFTMILLDKVRQLYKVLRPGFIAMIPVFLGCETANDIGLQYELQADANVDFIDFTIPATNIKIDSLRTDEDVSEDRILVGTYTDALTGSVTAEGYFSVLYRGTNNPSGVIDSTLIYDSIRFVLSASSFVSEVSSLTQAFSLYQLPDTLLNLVYLSEKSEPLGDLIGEFAEPYFADTSFVVNVELPRSFGESFFDAAQADSASLGIVRWPSFAMTPNAMTSAISEIDLADDTTGFYLYFTDPEYLEVIDGDSTFIDTTFVAEFAMVSSFGDLPHYTNLKKDNSTGLLNMTEDRQKQDLGSGQTIIDPLAGISTSITIPEGLEEFFAANDPAVNPIIINDVTITFEFEENSARDTLEEFYLFLETNGDFFGSGLVVNQFRNLIMSDEAFQATGREPAESSFGREDGQIVFSPTIFFQNLYNNYHDAELIEEVGLEASTLFVEDFLNEGFREFDGFVLISGDDVTLDRSIFKEDGISMRIYFTNVD